MKRIIFTAQTGNCREAMAAAILRDLMPDGGIEILARGLVVLFPEPMNQKAEAVLIANGLQVRDFVSRPLTREDITEDTMVFTMEEKHKKRVLEQFPDVREDQVEVLPYFVGDELETVDPYGGQLANYGLCLESLKLMLKKLVSWLEEQTETE